MKYLSRLLCVAILIWAIFSFSSRPRPKLSEQPNSPAPPHRQEDITTVSAAPARPKKQSRVRELSEWIQADLLCDGEGSFLRKQDLNESAEIYQALELARGNGAPNPCLSALLTKDKKNSLRYSRQSEHESCRLIEALLLTGQMGLDQKPNSKEIEAGKNLLRDLASLHPENGVYPFFLLGAERKPEHLSAFLRAKEFRNPFLSLSPRLREIGLTNSTSFLFSVEALATMKVPDYQAALRNAREMVSAAEYRSDYHGWLKTHLSDLEEIQRLKLGEPFVWAIDLAIQRSLALAGWQAHGEGAKPPLLAQTPWQDLFRQITNIDAYEPYYVNAEQPCERLQAAITALLPRFANQSEAMARRWAQYR